MTHETRNPIRKAGDPTRSAAARHRTIERKQQRALKAGGFSS